jgi:hypothetical protein
VIEHVRVGQPELPPGFPYDGKRYKWPPITKTWWDHWSDTTLNDGFTVHDWDYLMDTAVIHAKHWLGLDMKAGGELRQRLAKFGVTPEDRARLRIVMVDADTAEEKAAKAAALNAKVPTTGNARRLTAIPGFDVSTEDTG